MRTIDYIRLIIVRYAHVLSSELNKVPSESNSYIRLKGHLWKCGACIMSTSFKLYGFTRSTASNRVALIAKERGIPYEFIPVDLSKGEQKSASHLEHHPFGQVPYVIVRVLSNFPVQMFDFLMTCWPSLSS